MGETNGSAGQPVKSGQQGVGFLVNQTNRALNAQIVHEIRHYGLTLPGYVVLRHLLRESAEGDEGVPVEVLADKLIIPAAEISEAARRLEREGWLTVSGAATAPVLVPTRKSRSVMPVLIDTSRWMLEGALNGFSRAEIETLSELLKRVLHNLDAPTGEDEGPLYR